MVKKKFGIDEIVVKVISYIMVGAFALMCLVPFLIVLSGSFSSEVAVLKSGVGILPKDFSLDAYEFILKNPTDILNGYKITIFITVFGTLLTLVFTSMGAYALSRKDFAWRNKISFFMYFTTLFNAGLVPTFVWMSNLGFRDSVFAMIMPNLLSVFNILIFRNFTAAIPYEITESGKLDGANDVVIFFRLILPLTKPGFATIGLFSALTYWNEWYHCMLYISQKKMYSLQYYLYNLMNSAKALKELQSQGASINATFPSETVKLAMSILTIGPVILFYPFVQKYFVKGLVVGAVKG